MILLFMLLASTEVDAQKKKRRPSKVETKETTSKTEKIPSDFKEKLTYDIMLGNLGFNGGFVFGMKPAVGYKLTNNLSAGLAAKFTYYFFNRVGTQDVSFVDYGVGPYLRFKFLNQFYLQAEYDYNSLFVDSGQNRFKRWGPYFGGGYLSGYGDWTFGVQILFVFNNAIRDFNNQVVEYYFGATYNF